MIADLRPQEPASRRQAIIIAFAAPTDGIGRTGLVANLSWILAAAGERVLVLDCGTKAPRVHEYLRPFHAESPPVGEILGAELLRILAPWSASEPFWRVPPDQHEPSPPLVAREYRLQWADRRIDVIAAAGSTGPLGLYPAQPESQGERAQLRERIRATDYDYVFIDNPTDVSPAILEQTALLSDVVVMCFNPQYSGAIMEAATLARNVQNVAATASRIVPVAVPFDDQARYRAQQTRDQLRDAFADLRIRPDTRDGQDLPTGIVEIPYQISNAARSEALATLLDEPQREGSLLAGYEKLAGIITRGAVDRLSPVPPHVRARYRYAQGLAPSDAQPRIFLAYATEDRPWFDWVRCQLARAGARVAPLPPDDTWLTESPRPSVIALASPQLSRSPAGERVADIARRARMDAGFADRFDLVVVQISDTPVTEPLAVADPISFLRCDEEQARTRLLYRFMLVVRPGTGQRWPKVGFPAGPYSTHTRSQLPPRNPTFLGRGAEVEAIRDHFLATDGLRSWTLSGMPGMGKSEIAKEYAHRFVFDYDLQWWIPGESRQSVRESLTRLATEMHLPPGKDRPQAALDALTDEHSHVRWLLVYDNVGDIDDLAGLLPGSGPGHVIITTQGPASATSEATGEIGAFRSDDSITLLRAQVPDLSVDDAETIAVLVEHRPLGLRLAAAWMRENAALMHRQARTRAQAAEWAAVEFRARMRRPVAGQPARQAPGSAPEGLARVWGVIAETLRENDMGRLVLRLAQLCAFLSADGVALRLLRSKSMLTALASAIDDGATLILDSLELDQVMQSGSRFGLFDVIWERPPSLKIHRVIQELVRDAMEMEPEEHQERRRELLRGLADFAPTDLESGSQQDELDFAELQKHLEPSGAATSGEVVVRRWIVDHVGYLYRKNEPEAWQYATELSQRALAEWEPGPRVDDTSLRMRLQRHFTNLRRELSQDDPEVTLTQHQDLLEEQKNVLGPMHPATLKTGRSRGADLRNLGRFAEACGEEQITLRGFREVLGDDHPETLRAKHNLAFSYYLAGDVLSALLLEQESRAQRLALFGSDHLDVWWSACDIGSYLHELGRYEDARKELDEALSHILHLKRAGHLEELRIQRQRAIVMRRSGDAKGALDRNTTTLREYQMRFGEHHHHTLACGLSLALDHHQMGESATAVALAEGCLREYARLGLDHPFTAVCQIDLAMFYRSLGQVQRAFELGGTARGNLYARLGDEHPWTLAATINHAHGVAQTQGVEAATGLLQSAHDRCREFLPRRHPYTLRAEQNLASDLEQWGDIGVDLP